VAEQTAMVRIDDAWLRAADVSHMNWDRGHSYTNLRITMRDGTVYVVREWQGSAYDAERRLLEAIEHAAQEAAA
jgi:nucleotide-binding universal stress UspA family protein